MQSCVSPTGPYTVELTSERSVLIRTAGTAAVAALVSRLLSAGRFRNLHPAYSSVLVEFDPLHTAPATAMRELVTICESVVVAETPSRRTWEVPVVYGGDDGPDLSGVAAAAGLTEAEAVRLHSSSEYTVAFLGFSPGFPYLRGLPPQLASPRLPQPRTRVPAGTVAIGGKQTGIYPSETSGGWRLIGRTNLRLFDVDREPLAQFSTGDRIRFVPVDKL